VATPLDCLFCVLIVGGEQVENFLREGHLVDILWYRVLVSVFWRYVGKIPIAMIDVCAWLFDYLDGVGLNRKYMLLVLGRLAPFLGRFL
jgi:hypothetical protein